MKRIFVLLLATALVLTAATVFATIANTKHNLTSTGGQTTRTTNAAATLCGFCHIPHGGSTAVAGLPIWARGNPAGPFQVYGGGTTLNSTVVSNPPGAYSLTCLSCHDGTIGLGVITKNGVTTTYTMQGNIDAPLTGRLVDDNPATAYNPVIGTDLRNDHPVGFTYVNPAGGIPGINRPIVAAPPRIVGATSGNAFPLFMGTNQFECATCHDPHLEDTGVTQTAFLRAPNAGLCQDCHNTK